MTANEQIAQIRKELEDYENHKIGWQMMTLRIIALLMHGYEVK